MVQVREQRDVEPAVKEFVDTFSRPVTSACKYYALYYLVEIEGIDELAFKQQQVTSQLQDAFYNYSVFATTKEAANADRHFEWDFSQLNAVFESGRPAAARLSDSQEEIEKKAQERNKKRSRFKQAMRDQMTDTEADVITSFAKNIVTVPKGRDFIEEPVRTSERLERRYSIYTSSDSWLKALSKFFGTNWNSIYQDVDNNANQYGWFTNFGGDAWASVCDTALLYNEMGRNAYVDLMWSVEHNNGNFVDKVTTDVSTEQETIEEAIHRMETGRKQIDDRQQDVTETQILDMILPEVLSAARQEVLRFIFSVAEVAITDVSLRRYRTQIPDSKLQEEPINNLLR